MHEVAGYLKVDERTVYRMVKSGEIPGFRVRNQWRFKKESIDKWIENIEHKREIPIVGCVAAGVPIFAVENIEGTIVVDSLLVKNVDKVFALRIKGTSMVNAGIRDGDFVLVREQRDAEQGEIVVVLIEDSATVKRFYRDKDKIRLEPESDEMEPIIVEPEKTDVMIIGKVLGVIRKIGY